MNQFNVNDSEIEDDLNNLEAEIAKEELNEIPNGELPSLPKQKVHGKEKQVLIN